MWKHKSLLTSVFANIPSEIKFPEQMMNKKITSGFNHNMTESVIFGRLILTSEVKQVFWSLNFEG